ncbi:MAG TPA: lipocalin-like domain-containing protein [Chloroflexia bacterium]|nr:lipocalin-like domain-containing protein [Chloroflexia bacterium]
MMFNRFQRAGLLVVILSLLALLLAGCGDSSQAKEVFPTPSTNPNAGQIVATPSGSVPGVKVNFPLDEAPHNNITEWWYYTGHINTTDGSRYGFEYVVFQGNRGNFPTGYVSHFAVTDLNKQTFKYDQKIVAAQKKVVFGGEDGFNLALGNWTMQGKGGNDQLKALMKDSSYGIDLNLKDQKGVALHGGGYFSYGAAGGSYYYSRPLMSVTGSLTVDGQTKQVKDGIAWFDHQWGNFLPLSGGWDWYSLQLSDNSELMIYYLRDDKNNVVDVFGTYIPACNGPCNPNDQTPTRSVELHRDSFKIKALSQWTSPHSGGVYPSGWNVEISDKAVPNLNLTVKPQLQDQELDTRQTTSVIYWEGACEISGTKDGQPVSGQAYVELTGYATKSNNS